MNGRTFQKIAAILPPCVMCPKVSVTAHSRKTNQRTDGHDDGDDDGDDDAGDGEDGDIGR